MKLVILCILSIIVSLSFGCDLNNNELRQKISQGDAPFTDREIVINDLSKQSDFSIIGKKFFWGSVNYYSMNTEKEVFLLNLDPLNNTGNGH